MKLSFIKVNPVGNMIIEKSLNTLRLQMMEENFVEMLKE